MDGWINICLLLIESTCAILRTVLTTNLIYISQFDRVAAVSYKCETKERMSVRQLSPQKLLRLLPVDRKTRLTALVRPNRGADWALAHLLSSSFDKQNLTFLTTPQAAPALRQHTSANVQPFIAEGNDDSTFILQIARWAVENVVRNVVVADTQTETAISSLARLDTGVLDSYAGGKPSGVEMLPPEVLQIHKPLLTVDEAEIDATINTLPTSAHTEHVLKTEVSRAHELLGPGGATVESLLAHCQRRAHSIAFLRNESDELIRRCVLEASHWGYLVARRSTLLEEYESGAGGRVTVLHAMVRMIMHVSGTTESVETDDEPVARLVAAILKTDDKGVLHAMPKGRTVAGTVVRPATGRFAKRVLQADRRLRWRHTMRQSEQPDDLMIISREPDHETGTLFANRLRGNPACTPVKPDGKPVYWDNRFVMTAAPVADLNDDDNPFNAREIYKAVLQPPMVESRKKDLMDAELYVRQIRRTDWEKITAITNRVRNFQVPYECIRALPAVFQKERGSSSLGRLIASPHLGLSARPDLYFTAVRMPKFRSLPADVDPGFCEQHFQSIRSEEHRQYRRRTPSRRKFVDGGRW